MASPTGAIFTPLPAQTRPAVVGSLLTAPVSPSMAPGGVALPSAKVLPAAPVGTILPASPHPAMTTGVAPVRAGLPPVRGTSQSAAAGAQAFRAVPTTGAQAGPARVY